MHAALERPDRLVVATAHEAHPCSQVAGLRAQPGVAEVPVRAHELAVSPACPTDAQEHLAHAAMGELAGSAVDLDRPAREEEPVAAHLRVTRADGGARDLLAGGAALGPRGLRIASRRLQVASRRLWIAAA